jgi:hypothetical protein
VTVRTRSSGKSMTASSSHAVTLPSVTVGDRIIVGFVNDKTTSTDTTVSASGWTQIGTTQNQGTGTNHSLSVLTRVATGSDSLTVGLNVTQEAAWSIVVLEGDGGSPETPQFANGPTGSGGSASVGAITGLASGDYDSVIFLGLDNGGTLAHSVTPPAGWSSPAETAFSSSDVVGCWSTDRSSAGVTGFSPADVGFTNDEQWITAHIVVPQTSSEPVDKDGGDSSTGAETGGVDAIVDSDDSGTGAEAGELAIPGDDSGTGSEDGFVQEGKLGGDVGTGDEDGDTSATVTTGEATTGTEAGTTSADINPPTDAATGAEQGFIGIPGGDEAEGVDAHDPPTMVTVTTGESTTGSEGGYVETLFGDLIISLFAVDPDTGALIALPDYEALDFSRERNSKGAIRAQYPINGKDFDRLRSAITTDRDLEFELWTNGTPNGALRGYLQEAAGDDAVADDNGEDGSWQFAGSFLEVRTDETVVFPQDRGIQVVNPDTGDLEWTNPRRELIVNADSPGALMALLLEQAQDRGALTDIVADFTPSLDSNGDAWAGLLTARFSPGSTYTQILNKMVDLHLVEWAILWDSATQQKKLELWNAEGRGTDLTLGPRPVALRRGRNLLDAPRKWSVRDSATTVLAAGAEGLYDDLTDATALARRDRRVESYVSLNNIIDEEALLGFAQAELATLTPGLQSVEHGIGMLPGEPRPIIAFDIGDWIYSQSGIEVERLRVVQWTLSIDIERSLAGTVTLNTTIQDALEQMRERLDAIQSGEAVVGTSEPGADTVDRTPPAAPQGVVASSIAYQDPEMSGGAGGQTLSFITVGWLPVTTNADGDDNPLVQAAVFILDKMEDELANPEVPDPDQPDGGPDYDPILDDWTWKNCPQIVQDFNDALLAIWNDDGNPDAMTWLAEYIAEASATPTAADDVAGYDVRYAYLGLAQVGGIPSSDPFPEAERFYYAATPPGGTSATEYSFGGVEAGSRLRIEVRAFDRTGNFGAWTSISHDSEVDNSAPPTPSTPVAKTWFRTLDIAWDGLGSEGEVMPFDLSHARVWIGQGSDMTLPAEPVTGPVAFDPLQTAPQYVRDIALGAGTTNVKDLPYGSSWYVRLQTVDRTGNASAGSTVVGPFAPEQLFSDDLRDEIINDPNMIAAATVNTLHVVDAAIIGAKIALATIEEANIASVNAGSITTGTLDATVTVTGTLATSLNPGASRLSFSGAGMQLYRTTGPSTSVLVGEWRTTDGSMLVTGTLRSGLSGTRVHIDPDGSLRFYPPSGTNFSQITNAAGEAVWRGPLDGGSRSGRVNVNVLGVGINFSREADLLENIRAELLVLDRQTRMTSPFHNFIVDGRWSNPTGTSGPFSGRRIQLSCIDSDGNFISRSGISYGIDNSDYGGFYGNDTGWKLSRNSGGDGRFTVTNGTLGNYGVAQSAGWEVPSSGDVKENVEDARAALDPLATIRNARARKFRYTWDSAQSGPHIGVVAEELPEVLHRPMSGPNGEGIAGIELGTQIGVLWGALNQIQDQQIVSTSAVAVLLRSQLPAGGIFAAGESREVAVTWESTPPAAPTGGFVQLNSAFIWAGKVTAWIKTGSTTETGCVVVFKNISNSTVVVNETVDNLRISATAIGLGLFTPPYVPPEEA